MVHRSLSHALLVWSVLYMASWVLREDDSEIPSCTRWSSASFATDPVAGVVMSQPMFVFAAAACEVGVVADGLVSPFRRTHRYA